MLKTTKWQNAADAQIPAFLFSFLRQNNGILTFKCFDKRATFLVS